MIRIIAWDGFRGLLLPPHCIARHHIEMAWWRWIVLATCLVAPTLAHAGPLDAMRDEVDDDDDDSSGGGGGWSSGDDDDYDDDDSGGVGAAVGAAVLESIAEHNEAQGHPSFARYPYARRNAAALPYTGWIHRSKRSPGPTNKLWSLRVGAEGAYLGKDLWRSSFDIEAAFWRLSLRNETGLYIERGFVDALWMGSAVGYIAIVMQPKIVWRLGLGANYMLDARRIDDPKRQDGVGVDGSTTVDLFLVRPLVISARADIGRLGGANTVSARGTLGFVVRRFEGYGGWEYRAVGAVKTGGPVFGVRLWF